MNILSGLACLLLIVAHFQEVSALLAPASVALFVLVHLPRMRLPRRADVLLMWALAFVAYFCASIVFHNIYRDYAPMEILRGEGRVLYMIAVGVVVFLVSPNVNIDRPLFRMTIYATAGICLVSIFSLFVHPIAIGELRMSSEKSLLGLVGAHNSIAGQVTTTVCVLFLAVLMYVNGRGYGLLSPLVLMAGGIAGVSVLLCLSRTYTVACGAACLLATSQLRNVVIRRNICLLAGLASVVAMGYVLANRWDKQAADNADSRSHLYTRAWEVFNQSMLVGVGPGTFEEWNVAYQYLVPRTVARRLHGVHVEAKNYQDAQGEGGVHAHNSYLQWLVSYGVLGTGLFFAFLGMPVRRYFQLRREYADVDDDFVNAVMWNGNVFVHVLCLLSIAGLLGGYTWSSPPLSILMYISWGRFVRLSSELKDHEKEHETLDEFEDESDDEDWLEMGRGTEEIASV
ncbi:MAG: O-antigen ligase family protein [Pirellulaceae bacterium]|nr:O-antigen ligase family protein [Planctomycetales bacterium]